MTKNLSFLASVMVSEQLDMKQISTSHLKKLRDNSQRHSGGCGCRKGRGACCCRAMCGRQRCACLVETHPVGVCRDLFMSLLCFVFAWIGPVVRWRSLYI